jgi:membrane associated rhomboid family serine protease
MVTAPSTPPARGADDIPTEALLGLTLASPTVQTLCLFVAVFAVQTTFLLVDPASAQVFTLRAPVSVRPWTLLTSVYAHAGLGHLLSNALALVLVGLPFERSTTRVGYHAYFLVTGAVAGLVQVYLPAVVGGVLALVPGGGGETGTVGVIGASGAVFAVMGYVLTGNRLTRGTLDRIGLSARVQVAVFVVVAFLVTYLTASPGVALIAHFVGLCIGLLAGWTDALPARTVEDERSVFSRRDR